MIDGRAISWCLLPLLAACASTPAPDGSTFADRNAVATMHASKCSSCHTAPAPRTRTREHLEDALSRHRKRVHLTPEEWRAMVDYLAMPEGTTARQP
jgi:hypothetical protein